MIRSALATPGLFLPARPAPHAVAPVPSGVDRVAFDIGWDHAHHGLVPPADLLLGDSPVGQGWLAGKAVFGRRTLTSSRHTRQWVTLRLRAWQRGVAFDARQVTANYLGQIDADHCPVMRVPLQGSAGRPDTLTVAPLDAARGFAAGNLAVLSHAAADALAAAAAPDLVRAARRAESAAPAGDAAAAVDAASCWRLAVLRSFAQALPFAEAARLPLALLPPNRVHVVNAVQGLQALLTRSFLTPGWAARTRQLAQWLPAHSLRGDYHLFIGALTPRVLDAGQDPRALRRALEDAWLQERVQRRWLHLALSIGEAGVNELLERALAAGVGGVRTQSHAVAAPTTRHGAVRLPSVHDGAATGGLLRDGVVPLGPRRDDVAPPRAAAPIVRPSATRPIALTARAGQAPLRVDAAVAAEQVEALGRSSGEARAPAPVVAAAGRTARARPRPSVRQSRGAGDGDAPAAPLPTGQPSTNDLPFTA